MEINIARFDEIIRWRLDCQHCQETTVRGGISLIRKSRRRICYDLAIVGVNRCAACKSSQRISSSDEIAENPGRVCQPEALQMRLQRPGASFNPSIRVLWPLISSK